MRKRRSGYDFSEARKPFDAGRDKDRHPLDNVEAWAAMPDFPGFSAWWLSEDHRTEIRRRVLGAQARPAIGPRELYKDFWNPDFAINQAIPKANGSKYLALKIPAGPVRAPETHPLTASEVVAAKEFLQNNPRFFMALAALEYCVKDYIYGLFQELNLSVYSLALGGAPADFASSVYKNAGLGSVTGEMALIMAESLSHEEEPFTSKSLGKALCAVFQRQAFKSTSPSALTYMECPFAHGIAAAQRTGFTENAGRLTAKPGQGHGALILFLMEYLPQRYPGLLEELTPPGLAPGSGIAHDSLDV